MSNLLLIGDTTTAAQSFCRNAHEVLGIIGWILTIIKIAIPLVIIALGLIDLAKAAISSKPEEIKKSATGLIWRFVGGVAIFFIPTIVMIIFGFVSGFGTATEQMGKDNWNVCYKCITAPWDGACKNAKADYD